VTSTGRPRPQVDAGRLWAGGLATAAVAALIAVVDLVIGPAVLSLLSSVMARALRPPDRVR